MIGGGWVPSAVRTLPAAVNAIGVYLLFESAFGVTPLEPSIVTIEVAGADHGVLCRHCDAGHGECDDGREGCR